MRLFRTLFQPDAETRILDIGGTAGTWTSVDVRPKVVLLNLEPEHDGPLPPHIHYTSGDATGLPYADDSFEIAFSNSVIEHVGDYASQQLMAGELRRVAPAYYLQTPCRTFPIEPHYLTPFVHWLPRAAQRRILRNFSVWGLIARPTQDYVDELVLSTRLLARSELCALFPDGVIIPERVFGLVKSWIVVRQPRAAAAVGCRHGGADGNNMATEGLRPRESPH